MPPSSTIDVPLPRPSAADDQVLRDWIASCMGEDHFDAGASAPPDAMPGDVQAPLEGILVACPATAPGGACAIEKQNCTYPDQDCFCDHGVWNCAACPAQQPPIGGACPNGSDPTYFRPPSSCLYGALTCGCDPGDPSQSDWRCGVCPATEPATGSACGNTMFTCPYGNDSCHCLGGTWSCQTPSCPTLLGRSFTAQCNNRFSCQYPSLGTSCNCTFDSTWSCSCPASVPAEGEACAALDYQPCTYADESCSCGSSANGLGAWHCTAACPTSAPSAGSACHSSLNCSYGSSLCYCDGAIWHC